MYGFRVKTSFLTRSRQHFLELSQAEVDAWMPRVFDRIRPQMLALCAILFEEDEPINLPLILDLTMDDVRMVASEMAGALLQPDRLETLLPRLNAFCDDLLRNGREQEAAFIQDGLIRHWSGAAPGHNPLMIEICAQSIYQQVDHMSQIRQRAPRSH